MISPTLVEVGRHLNIEILPDTELLDVAGEAGNFIAKLKQSPRFIDIAKCAGCGECAEACPVDLVDDYNEGLAFHKATYKQYAQAVPGAYAICKGDTAPCRLACPAHLNVQGYVQMVKEGKYREALEIIMKDLPLPGVLGRVCPHECENVCRRADVDAPVAIRNLKRLAADMVDPREIKIECAPQRKERVAIIGSGPAGLSAAYQLARQGIRSTIFEALEKPGGMLRVGIPNHRLPEDVLDREIEVITNLGVEIKTNTRLGRDISIDGLLADGYKAVYLALGAHQGTTLRMPHEDAVGVRQGVDFLREVNLTGATEVGKKIAVIGGGNVAIDVCRAAVRLGAEEVTIVYRRTRAEMPAWEEEIVAAEEEGVKIKYLKSPKEVLTDNGRVCGLRCIEMKLSDPDESGRRRPVPVDDSEHDLEFDQIILAIGQRPDTACLEGVDGMGMERWGGLKVDPVTFQTGRPGVFAGGDVQTGPDIAIAAIAAGKEAAVSIQRYLDGEDLQAGREQNEPEVPDYRPIPKDAKSQKRAAMPELEPADRRTGFVEVELGYGEDEGRAEAARCINCGYCCECFQCVEACKAEAIDHTMTGGIKELNVGAVIMTPGFEPFDPSKFDNYNYSKLPDVVTSMEFERMLSASGPTGGHLIRLSDHQEPKKIAWLQCVGSRDINRCDHAYCSSVCCMYAIKQTIIAKEHAGEDLDCAVFYMDMRTHGKDFERYYNKAKNEAGVRFVNSRVHTIVPDAATSRLSVRYVLEDGQLASEEFDMIVLSIGMAVGADVVELSGRLGVELTAGNFARTMAFTPVQTSREGIFACGAFQSPKDIPQSVVDASAASAAAGELLSEARNTCTVTKEIVPETNVVGLRPRIGVFVCNCGSNIAGVVDVPAVRDYAATLPYVEFADDNLYSCSQDTQEKMTELIKEKNLNRVVVAACTPKTHEPVFQETLINAGLNKYLFEMTNIRNQDSWVHRNNPEVATEKAKDLIRMSVARVALAEPLEEAELQVNPVALVIGGGISGMTSALSLARQGYETHLVERSGRLGGQALNLFKTADGTDVRQALAALIDEVSANNKIRVYMNAELSAVEGFVGNFKSTITAGDQETTVEHGVAVVATGASPYQPDEYAYGQDPRIITSLDLDKKFMADDSSLAEINSAVFVQCVGSREPDRPYCSRVCCTHSIDNALELKKRNPDMNVYVLYRDIRTYGEREYLFRKAREAGVIFIRYKLDDKPIVSIDGDSLTVTVTDHILGRKMAIETDLLTLATAIVPNETEKLAGFFKISVNDDGMFAEKHAKLGPSEFATDGVYLCGMAHYPKPVDEAVAQGKAAASRAVTLLSREIVHASGNVARVNPAKCSACGVCLSICPYSAPSFIAADARFFAGKAQINPVLCKGCGLCVASCRSGAIMLKGFDNNQIFAQIFALKETG